MPVNKENQALQKSKETVVDFREISLTGSSIYHGSGIIDYNPDELVGKKGLNIYKKMREDDQVKAVLTMKKYARLMTSWEIQPASEQPVDVEIAEFVKDNLDNLAGTFEDVLLGIYTALEYGYSISEKVWYQIEKGEWAGKIGIKAIKTREPFYYGFESDEFGNLKKDGIIYMGPTPTNLTTQMQERQITQTNVGAGYGYRLPVDKFIVYSYNKEFSNWYGRSDLRAAYRSWYSKEILIRFMNIYMERFGMPTHVAKYPKNMSKTERDNLKTVLDRVQAKYSILIPDDMAIDLLEAASGGGDSFKNAIEMHNKFISRSILVPDLMGYNEVSGGAYALGKKHFDVFLWILQKLGKDTEESIVGEQLIKQLVDFNYSNVIDYPKFKFESITAEGTATRANIIQMGVAGGFINPQEEWIRPYLALPKSDPKFALGLPTAPLDNLLPGRAPQNAPQDTPTTNPNSTEGLKDKEDIQDDEVTNVGDSEFTLDKNFAEKVRRINIYRLNESRKLKTFTDKILVSVNSIKMHPEQSKVIDMYKVRSMMEVIKRGEDTAPIEIDTNGNLLNGHHRLTAYKTLGIEKIPAIVSDVIKQTRKFQKINGLELDHRFDYKVNFTQMKDDIDEYESETVSELSGVILAQKDALLKTIERKKLLENKDYDGVNALQLKFVGDFKSKLENRLVKLYLDSKLEAVREVSKGSDGTVEVVTKFADITIQNWIPVEPSEAVDFFNRKVTTKVVQADGVKKLLTLATRKELNYYDAIAFAIAGVEKDNILKQAKLILLNGIKTGDQKEAMYGLGKLFDSYLVTGELKDEELTTPYRLETIVRTNFSEAINAGRKALMDDPDLKGFVPYVQYKAILDDRVRPTHAEMHNKIFTQDNPVLDMITPPNGFNCRCLMVPITKFEVERLIAKNEGIELSTEADLPSNFPDTGFGKYASALKAVAVTMENKDGIVRCPYSNCGSGSIKLVEKDEMGTRILQCKDCLNLFKVTRENDLYLFDKGLNKWVKSDNILLPKNITAEKYSENITKCPYSSCGSGNITLMEKDKLGTQIFQCKDCLNLFKVTTEGDLYLFDKGSNEWKSTDNKILPSNITGEIK